MIPTPGTKYRHYKSTGGDNHTYEVVGIGRHSETEELMVIYAPLFDTEGTRIGEASMAVRPLDIRLETVIYQGNEIKRFTKID